MAKTNEELKALKQECELFDTKAKELTEDELEYVVGGSGIDYALLTQLGLPIYAFALITLVPDVK